MSLTSAITPDRLTDSEKLCALLATLRTLSANHAAAAATAAASLGARASRALDTRDAWADGYDSAADSENRNVAASLCELAARFS